MDIKQFNRKIVSKKFFAFLLVLSSSNILLWFGKLDADSYQAILMMVTPLYFASDVGADFVRKDTKTP